MHALIRNAANLTLEHRLTEEESNTMLHHLLGALQCVYLTEEDISKAINRALTFAIGQRTIPCTPSASATTPPSSPSGTESPPTQNAPQTGTTPPAAG